MFLITWHQNYISWHIVAQVWSTRRRSPWVNLRRLLRVGAWIVLSRREDDHLSLLSTELKRLDMRFAAICSLFFHTLVFYTKVVAIFSLFSWTLFFTLDLLLLFSLFFSDLFYSKFYCYFSLFFPNFVLHQSGCYFFTIFLDCFLHQICCYFFTIFPYFVVLPQSVAIFSLFSWTLFYTLELLLLFSLFFP